MFIIKIANQSTCLLNVLFEALRILTLIRFHTFTYPLNDLQKEKSHHLYNLINKIGFLELKL